MEAEVALAVSPRAWSDELHRFVADHGGVRVRTRVLTPEDALMESYDVLVIDDISSFLTRRLVAQVHAEGRLVLGVYDPDEAREGKQRLLEVGVDEVIEAEASPDEFLVALRALASSRSWPGPVDEKLEEPETRSGRIVIVAGASGGVGATEIALGLALAMATRIPGTVLVDADDQGPALAQRLALDLEPNLRSAIDELHHGRGDPTLVLSEAGKRSLQVLPGLASRADWFEIRPRDVVEVLHQLARRRRMVLANVGSGIEDLASIGGPMRTGLSRAMVAAADRLVLVASASPVGLARLIDWLADARDLIDGIPRHLVVNRAAPSPYKRAEILRELAAVLDPASVTFTPEDREVEAAAWAGVPVTGGKLKRPLRSLARMIAAGA